jgi:putative hydrolase of the HAD superfamily
VTEALGLSAGECVFVDDQKRNADGGVKAGMRVVHFDVLHPQTSFDVAARLLQLPTKETNP